MIFRKATTKDYMQIQRMYVDSSKQWLYLSEDSTEMPEEELQQVLYNLCFPEDFLHKINQLYETYSYDDFCKDLKQREKLYYVFETKVKNAKKIVGYVIFSKNILYQIDPKSNKPLWNAERRKVLNISEWGVESLSLLPRMGGLLKSKFPGHELQAFPSKRWCKQMFEFMQSNQCGP
ncbi:MAG: hypothetical protein J6J36_02150 [Clostridia bacterium]|nr:hypothetical protein [Clostridia bacterium]